MSRDRAVLLRPSPTIRIPEEGGTIYLRATGADYKIDPSTGCWLWLRGIDPQGYGRSQSPGCLRRAHREYYRRAKGDIPAGWHVHHTCHVRHCVNPDHLEAIGHSEHITHHARGDWSTLTWDDVRAIRDANRAGVGIYELADRYSLSIGTLHPLILNRTWVDPDYVPGVDRDCEECNETFRTTKVNKRFCSKGCRNAWNARRTGRRSRGQALDGSETRSYRKTGLYSKKAA